MKKREIFFPLSSGANLPAPRRVASVRLHYGRGAIVLISGRTDARAHARVLKASTVLLMARVLIELTRLSRGANFSRRVSDAR